MTCLPALILGLSLALASSSAAADVKVDYDTHADFSRYKTWSWRTGTAAPNPVSDKRIREDIEARLAARGITRVDKGGPLEVVIDAASGKVVWRGQAQEVADPTYTDVIRKIDQTMDKLFEHFPPAKR